MLLILGDGSNRWEIEDAAFGHPRNAVLIPWHLILQFETGDGKLASSEQGDAGCGLFAIDQHHLGVKPVAGFLFSFASSRLAELKRDAWIKYFDCRREALQLTARAIRAGM